MIYSCFIQQHPDYFIAQVHILCLILASFVLRDSPGDSELKNYNV